MGRSDWVWDLVELSAALAAGDVSAESAAFERLSEAGRAREVEELLLQSYLFLGFPTALESLRRWRTTGAPAPEPTAEGPELWARRGVTTCRTVYGDKYERLRENVAALHPDLDRWMVEEGYGKVLGRPALALDIRELCIVAMLVVTAARRQLRSHLQGALNAGASPADVERTLEHAGRLAGEEGRALAEKLWRGVQQRA